MNKNVAAARKRTPAKPSVSRRLALMKESDNSRSQKPMKISEDPRFVQAVQNYEAGLKAMQTHKYDRAKACFEKVMNGASPELADRAAVHLNTCNQHLKSAATQFRTPEEQYDYAISLMNLGDYLAARENFETLVKKFPQLDYIWYGMAALNCLMGHYPESITGLNEAIRLNPANRFQARNDSDFRDLADDPRFTELLYPDTSAEVPPPDSQNWHF